MTTKPFVITKRLVWEAYQRVKANQGSAGIDAVSIEAFDQHRNSHLYRIWNRLSSGSDFPPAVQAVPMPRKSGGTQILDSPAVLLVDGGHRSDMGARSLGH
jgi:RNA-directed DNA polymerase